MSSTGPPQTRKGKRGSGCRRSALLCPTNMRGANRFAEISPSSNARRAV